MSPGAIAGQPPVPLDFVDGNSAIVQANEAYGHYLSENLTEARSVAIDVLQRARRHAGTSADLISRVLVALSHIESWTGEYAQALTYLEEAGLSSAVSMRVGERHSSSRWQ